MGEAAHDVRSAAGLGALAGLLAAGHPAPRPGHQLGPRPGVGGGGHHPILVIMFSNPCASFIRLQNLLCIFVIINGRETQKRSFYLNTLSSVPGTVPSSSTGTGTIFSLFW